MFTGGYPGHIIQTLSWTASKIFSIESKREREAGRIKE